MDNESHIPDGLSIASYQRQLSSLDASLDLCLGSAADGRNDPSAAAAVRAMREMEVCPSKWTVICFAQDWVCETVLAEVE